MSDSVRIAIHFFVNFDIFKWLYPKVVSHPGYQTSTIRKNFTMLFLKYKLLKLKLRVFLAVHSFAMVTYSATKIIPTCSPMIGQSFDTIIVTSTDREG